MVSKKSNFANVKINIDKAGRCVRLLNNMQNNNFDFKIVPIFNQTIGTVWTDFINIEAMCDKKVYKIHTGETGKKRILGIYKCNLHDYKHNFAFAAYRGKKMVGFTQGYVDTPYETYLEHLYVSPRYHKYGIGTQLLKTAEQMSSLIAIKIKLTALNEAVGFYEKNGYNHVGYMEKELTPVVNSVVPVFQWVKKDFNVKFNLPVDTMFLKQNKYQPVFVYVNEYARIDGVGVKTVDNEKKVWTNNNDIVRMELLNALGKTK